MKITYHGGSCCGIKQINGLYSDGAKLAERHPPAPAAKYQDIQRLGGKTSSAMDLFVGHAPSEKPSERLKRYVNYMRENQPLGGLIECTTYSRGIYYVGQDEDGKGIYISQTEHWRPMFEENGFKEVTTFFNGNSKYYVTVWHLVYGTNNEGIE